MKRLLCVLLLLPAFVFVVQAVPRIDGNVQWPEYGEKPVVLIHARYESNNNVSYAFLCQYVSPENRSVYIGVKYVCDDLDVMLRMLREEETGDADDTQERPMTGIEVSLNGEKCFTALLDGSVHGMDTDRFDADTKFRFYDDTDTDNPDTNNFDGEIRLGVKYWIPYNSVLGLRVLDCSGIPSNFYEIPIYPEPTTASGKSDASEKSTAVRSTTVKRTEAVTSTRAAAGESSATSAQTTVRVITAAATAARTTTTRAAQTETQSGTTAGKTAPRVTTTDKIKAKETTATTVRAADAIEEPTVEPSATAAAEETNADISIPETPRFSALQSGKTIGIVFAAVMLTAAVMTAVFIGVQQSGNGANTPKPDTPPEEEEEPDDF